MDRRGFGAALLAVIPLAVAGGLVPANANSDPTNTSEQSCCRANTSPATGEEPCCEDCCQPSTEK